MNGVEDHVMADPGQNEQIEDPAAENQAANLRAEIAEAELEIEVLTTQLENVQIHARNRRTEVEAAYISLAMKDVNEFLTHVTTCGMQAVGQCDEVFKQVMAQTLRAFVAQLDNGPATSYFIPTDGNTDPAITVSTHQDGRVLRVQRWNMGQNCHTLGFEMFLGPSSELANLCYRQATPSTDWLDSLIDWRRTVGDANITAPPMPPLFLGPAPTLLPVGEANESAVVAATAVPVRPPGLDPSEPRVKKVIELVGGTPNVDSRLPVGGAAFFDYSDGYDNHVLMELKPEEFVGKKAVLLITNSVGAHTRLSKPGYGFFVDLGGKGPQVLRYPRYDLSHLPDDEPDMVYIQCSFSGVYHRYGQYPKTVAGLKRFIEERGFKPMAGFHYSYVVVQHFTNEIKHGLSPEEFKRNPKPFPITDEQLFSEMILDGNAYHETFEPSFGTVILGPGSPKWRHSNTAEPGKPGPTPLERTWTLHPKSAKIAEKHKALHRLNYLLEKNALDDVERARRNEVLEVVHSPLRMLPTNACVRKDTSFGHVHPAYFLDLGVNFINAARNGFRLLDPTYRCALLLCGGVPRHFSNDVDPQHLKICDGVHPKFKHTHKSQPCTFKTVRVHRPSATSDRDLGTWYSLVRVEDYGGLEWTFW